MTGPCLISAEPDVTPQKFRLDVDGAVENRLSLTLDEFMALPQTESVSDIHCVTQWSRYDNRWKGVAAQALLAIVRSKPEARRAILFHSFDGYTANVRLEQFDQPDVFLVHEWKLLSRAHGGPVRMLILRLYFSGSRQSGCGRIQFTVSDRPGFWEQRGYHNNGDPWQE